MYKTLGFMGPGAWTAGATPDQVATFINAHGQRVTSDGTVVSATDWKSIVPWIVGGAVVLGLGGFLLRRKR